MIDTSSEQDDPRLHERVAELPREVQPAHDLWPGIERRLAPHTGAARVVRRGAFRAAPLLAAAALLAIGVAGGFLLRNPVVDPSLFAPAEGPLAVPAKAGERAAESALAVYRSATAELRADLDQRLAAFDPDIRALVAREMARIDAAIHEIERALADTPDDPVLEGFLLARYRQQVDLLNRWIPVAG